jgi:hypothetical protein
MFESPLGVVNMTGGIGWSVGDPIFEGNDVIGVWIVGVLDRGFPAALCHVHSEA